MRNIIGTAAFLGIRGDNEDGWDRNARRWTITLLRKLGPTDNHSFVTEYTTGSGIDPRRIVELGRVTKMKDRHGNYIKEWRDLPQAHHRLKVGDTYPLTHEGLAMVLENLISDSSIAESARDFEDFAADLGYDKDSRKAENLYRDVLSQHKRFTAFLGEPALDYSLHPETLAASLL